MNGHKARCRVERRRKSKYIRKRLKDESNETVSAGDGRSKTGRRKNRVGVAAVSSLTFVPSGAAQTLSRQHFDTSSQPSWQMWIKTESFSFRHLTYTLHFGCHLSTVYTGNCLLLQTSEEKPICLFVIPKKGEPKFFMETRIPLHWL